ncbi:MAG: segregation and condensation protein A [Thermoguttaceae bacterium]
MSFSTDLPIFKGPLDLLLYLVKKHELDILNIPITTITDQYLEYLAVLKDIDVNAAGDFLAIASTLVEIKSLEVLPGEEVVNEEVEDPRKELVQQLLAYKEYCDTAQDLEKRGKSWQLNYPRLENDLPRRPKSWAEEPIREVELWDLVSAFGRIIRENAPAAKHQVIYDDTPISTHMQRIYNRLKLEGNVDFASFFEPGQHKTTMIGIFLAVLELVRHEFASVEQDEPFGQITLKYRESSKSPDFASIDG